LPVVVLALVKVGLLEHVQMKTTRPYAIVVIFLLAAVITPTPDVFTLVLMGAPMVLLYEACIWIARWMERREALTKSGADRNDQTPDPG
jgi:sec-independent protein translocase protein TatC